MNNYTIKSVIRKLYSIDYNNLKLEDNVEMIISKKTNDFHQLLYMNNEITNVQMIPQFESDNVSTQTGLFYKKDLFYNHPKLGAPLISFRLMLIGTKLNSFYRIRFIVRGIEVYDDTVSKKVYVVLNGKDIIYNKELPTGKDTVIEYIYLSEGSVINLAFTIGKVAIKDIIIEEIEVQEDVKINERVVEIPDLVNLKAYSVFKPSMLTNRDKILTKFPLLRGIGLNVIYNREDDIIIVERNKENDIVQESIGLYKYFIDVRVFNGGEIRDLKVSDSPSPFSGYNGYASFKVNEIKENTLIYVLVYELL